MNSNEENRIHEERRVAELVGTLRRIDAPGDFEARVRSRIAQRRYASPHRSMVPVFAGVVTLAVLAFVGYLGLRSWNTPAKTQQIETANTQTSAPIPANSSQPTVSGPTPNAPTTNGQTVATTTQSKDKKPANHAPQGGSIDEASKDDHKLNGRSFDPAQRKSTDNNVVGSGQIPVTVIFDAVGAHAYWNGSGWQVDKVRSQSVADLGGLRTGDVIESIGGHPVGENTTFSDSLVGKSLRVRRKGAAVEIPFKP
jgi:hypothetical protein